MDYTKLSKESLEVIQEEVKQALESKKELTIEGEMNEYTSRFQSYNCSKWESFEVCSSRVNRVYTNTWNYMSNNGILFHVIKSNGNDEFHEIVRRKKK